MAFDYNSRTRLEKEKLAQWDKDHAGKIRKLTPKKKEFAEEIGKFSDYPHCGFPVINKWTRANVKGGDRTLKEIILKEFGDLVEIFVPDQYRQAHSEDSGSGGAHDGRLWPDAGL